MIRWLKDWFIGGQPGMFLRRPLIVYKWREWRHRLRRALSDIKEPV